MPQEVRMKSSIASTSMLKFLLEGHLSWIFTGIKKTGHKKSCISLHPHGMKIPVLAESRGDETVKFGAGIIGRITEIKTIQALGGRKILLDIS